MGSPLIGSFQTRVNLYNPLGVEGDFASANPRATALTPDGGAFVAGPGGVTVGKFAWVAPDGRTVNSFGESGVAPSGFIHRDQQGLLTQYLQAAGMLIPPGFPVTLMVAGDFLAKNAGTSSSTVGEAIYALYADGSVLPGVGSLPAVPSAITATLGSTNTGSLGATFTASAHAGDNTRIDVTAVTGLISIGDTVGNVTGIAGNQTVISQDSGGTTGGAGTYVLSGTNTASAVTCTCFGNVVKITASTGLVSVGEFIASAASGFPVGATVTGIVSGGGVATAGVYTISVRGASYVASATGMTTYGTVLDVTAVTGTLLPGMPITATGGIPAGASIAGFISGTYGGVGLYSLNIPGTAYTASGTIVITAQGIITKFTAKSVAAVGELVQISTWGN
jgi:hypothetical protein